MTLAARVMQVFSSDDGTTDIGDFQYVIFNVVTAIYFVAHVINDPSVGLPPIPDTLLGLTGVSGALYVAKKAATTAKPTIGNVFPQLLRPDMSFTVTGTALTPLAGSAATLPAPKVTVNGIECTDVAAHEGDTDRITAKTPSKALLTPVGTTLPMSGKVTVLSAYSVLTAPYDVTIDAALPAP